MLSLLPYLSIVAQIAQFVNRILWQRLRILTIVPNAFVCYTDNVLV